MPGLQEAFDRIGEALERRLPSTHAPGAALAVTDGDEILGAVVRGLANVDRGTPISPHTRFQIASMSKSFAGLLVMQEVAAGRLDLHTSINEILPWLEMPEPYGPVTLHHLMTHTGGLVIGSDRAPWGTGDSLLLRSEPPAWPPGSRARYSNGGWKLVGHALEQVTGGRIDELIDERILQPLGMRDSEGGLYDAQRADCAVGYLPMLTDRPAHLESPLAPAPWQLSITADGSIVSTVVDMSAYLRLVLARGAPLLDEGAFAAWIGPHADAEDEGDRYGYGWVTGPVEGQPMTYHTGTNLGFNGLMGVRPEDGLGVVLLLNGWGERRIVCAYALACVHAALSGEPLPEVPQIPAPDLIEDAASYEGEFTGEGRTWRVRSQDGGLFLEAGPVGVRLQRVEDALIAPHPALERSLIIVERGPDGRVVALGHGPSRYTRDGAPPAVEADGLDRLGGAYRGASPWAPLLRVDVRAGALWLTTPLDGTEQRLHPNDDGSFTPGEPDSPERVRFEGDGDGPAQTIRWSGAEWFRSAMD